MVLSFDYWLRMFKNSFSPGQSWPKPSMPMSGAFALF
jgi:hypothetical protein